MNVKKALQSILILIIIIGWFYNPGWFADLDFVPQVKEAHAAISFVGSAKNTSKDTNFTLVLTVPAGGWAAGSSVILTTNWAQTTAFMGSIVDSAGNTYVGDAAAVPNCLVVTGQSPHNVFSAHNINALSAGNTITITWAAGFSPGVRAALASNFTGLASTNTKDKSSTGCGSGTAANSGNTVQTTQADELVFGSIAVNGPIGDGFTKGGTYTLIDRSGTTGGAATSNRTVNDEYKIVSSLGQYAADATLGTSREWSAIVVTYKAASTAVPVLNQNHYRWRDDTTALNTDGGWLAAEDLAYSPLKRGDTIRLRTEIANTGTASASSYTYRLEYGQKNGAPCGDDETFAAVPVTPTTEHWEMVTTTQYADGDSVTPSRLTATGTFVSGKAVEDPSNQTAAFSLTNGNYTEFEYAIKATPNALSETAYCFRLTNAGSTTNFTYSIYPEVTTAAGIDFVNAVSNSSKTLGGSLTLTVPAGGWAAGSSVIITTAFDSYCTVPTGLISVSAINDTASNSYNRDAVDLSWDPTNGAPPIVNGCPFSPQPTMATAVWSAHNINALAAGSTITIDFPLDITARAAWAANFKGLETASTKDVFAYGSTALSGANTSPNSGNTSVTNQADELIFGGIGFEGPSTDTFTQGGTYTLIGKAGTSGGAASSNMTSTAEYKIVSATGQYAADGTLGTASQWVAVVVTYKAKLAGIALKQNHYRWRDDSTALNTDGGWLATEDADINTTVGQTLRMRAEIANTGVTAASNYNYRLQYGKSSDFTCGNGDETYTDVPVTPTTEHWEMVSTTQYADGDSVTPSRLTATGTFVSGKAIEDPSNQTAAFSLTNGNYTEFEYAIKATNNAVFNGSTTYCFRLTNAGSTNNFVYSTYPKLTLLSATGRIFSSGFELQSLTPGVEWTTTTGTLDISTSIKRGGNASLEVKSLVSGTEESAYFQGFMSGNNNGPLWSRAYLRIAAAPTAENRIFGFQNDAGAEKAYITLDSNRQLRLYDEDGAIGSASSALSLDAWYRIEIKFDATGGVNADTVEARIDGTNFATSSTRDLSTGVTRVIVGGNLNLEAQTAGNWFFDDIALNNVTAASQNNYPGPGVIVHLRPNGNGDTVTCTGSGDYTAADEITPNEDTDYIDCRNLGNARDVNLFSPSDFGMRSSDTVNFATLVARSRTTGVIGAQYRIYIKASSGGTIYPDPADPLAGNHTLTNSYDTNKFDVIAKPDGGSWTLGDLENTQMGVTAITEPGSGTNGFRHTILQLLVEFVPATNIPDYQTQYKATHSDIIATGGSTSDGVTTNVYLDSYVVSSLLSDVFTPQAEVRNVSTAFSNSGTHSGSFNLNYDTAFPDDIRSACTVYDNLNDRMVMWGGQYGNPVANSNDTWILWLKEGHNAQWQKLSTAGTLPQANRAQVCVYDELNDRLVVYGGWNGTTYLKNVYFLSLPSTGTPTWSQPSVTGSPPAPDPKAPLQGHGVYDPSPSRMIVYGGYYDTDTDIDTVYELTLPSSGNPTWNNLGLNTGPSASGQGRDAGVMVYDADSDRAIMYGGHINTSVDQVWELNLIQGAEAWTQISPAGGNPGIRALHTAVFQPNYNGTDDRMVSFGGSADSGGVGNLKDDVWQLVLPESGGGTWVDKSPLAGYRPWPNKAATSIYDPIGRQALIVAGFDTVPDPNIFSSDRSTSVDLSADPSAFEFRSLQDVRYLKEKVAQMASYDPVNKDVIMFGGAFGSGAYSYHIADTWLFRVDSLVPSWRLANVDSTPLPRQDGNLVYDTNSNRTVMCFGLSGFPPNYLNDCWEYSFTSSSGPKWSGLVTEGSLPTERFQAYGIYDELNDRLVIFGGTGGSSSTVFNDLNFLSLGATPTWSVPSVNGSPPSARKAGVAVYDPNRDRMVLFGGNNSSTHYNQVYQLTLPSTGNPTWSQLSPTGTLPTVRRDAVGVYDPDRGDGTARMVVFGGYDGTNFLGDVWELSLPASGDGAWTQLSPSGTGPSVRRSMGAEYDPVNDRMIIMGGREANTFFADTWVLNLNTQNGSWTRLFPDKKIPFTVAASSLTNSTSYHWQAWLTGSASGDSPKAAYGGNSDTPPAGVDFTISTTTLPPTGDLTSVTFDTGIADPAYNSIVWKGTLPLSTRVRFRIAASDSSSGPWSDSDFIGSDGVSCGSSFWYEPSGADVPVELGCFSNFNNKRYFRYKVQLCSNSDCSTGGMQTPTVEDVIINWSP